MRAAHRVSPEHLRRVQVARVRELAGHLGNGVGAARRRTPRGPRGTVRAAVLIAPPPDARRRGSSGTRCNGTDSPRAPHGSRRRSGREHAARARLRRRRSPACRSRTERRLRRRKLAAPGAARRRRASPSTVTTSWPSACAASTRHEQTSSPSRSTEHEPHSPCSQAFFEPGSSSRSRRVVSRLSPAQTSASRTSPLTVTSILTRDTSRARAA